MELTNIITMVTIIVTWILGIVSKGILSTIRSCCQGSLAIGTNGTMYILKGDTNEWIPY